MSAAEPSCWFVYVLINDAGVSYTGIAKDVAARLAKHNAGSGARFTRGRGPWRLLHVEGPSAHGDALRREMAIKRDGDFKARLKGHGDPATLPSFHPDDRAISAIAGAYVLLVELDRQTPVHLPGRADIALPAGRYLYCGSARGPGGLKARIGRHMRRDKTIRWHIDQLTSAGRVLGAWLFPDGCECALSACLSAFPVPIPGFGSSDCPTCRSHLLAWPSDGSMHPPWTRPASLSPNGDRGRA